MQPYSEGTFDDVAKNKFEQAEDDLEAEKCYKKSENIKRQTIEDIILVFMR